MKDQVKKIVFEFKDHGWTVQKLEAELGFSNGSLGKVMNGSTSLSEYRFNKLTKFREEKIVIADMNKSTNQVKEIKPKTVESNSVINTLPLNLIELKAMCPHPTGTDRSLWIATERQKYGI